MRSTLVRNLEQRFRSYSDLIESVDDTTLCERLATPKNKSLAEHLWCVVGARESFAKAIRSGAWSGFGCSVDKQDRDAFAEKLESSARAMSEAIASVDAWTDARNEFLVSISEHEVMHEGQIIRHMYGLEKSLPDSWKWA